MARVSLARVVRGRRETLDELRGLLAAPVRVEDLEGAHVYGDEDAPDGVRHPIEVEGEVVGAVIGSPAASTLAHVLAALFLTEKEKLALAAETLGRYKELTLLYDMSDALSRVLDVDEVAELVVGQAHRFLRAGGAQLFLVEGGSLDTGRGRARCIASVGADAGPLEGALEARVLESGHAELLEEASERPGLLCAPLRSGDSVFGLLRVTQGRLAWTAGDLKLVTSISSNAASAIRHAMLHRDQLRQQALRSQIERFVSPRLLMAALEEPGLREATEVAVLFCDLGALARALDADASARDVLGSLLLATSAAVDAMMASGATVNVTQGELLVAVFPRKEGFAAGAIRAAKAALGLSSVLESALGTRAGVGIAAAPLSDSATFLAGVGTAAMLQSAAAGRIVCGPAIAKAVGGAVPLTPRETLELASGAIQLYEVRA